MLENEVPVFVVTFTTQEVLCFKNAKSGEVITRIEDKLTAGWNIVEMARCLARAYL